jgi:hypothetical protein
MPTYRPLPISSADLRRLSDTFRDLAPHLSLSLDHTDTGEPFVSVMAPGDGTLSRPPFGAKGVGGCTGRAAVPYMGLRRSGSWRSSLRLPVASHEAEAKKTS